MNNHAYNLKNAGIFLQEIISKKISENKACELYDDLIKRDIDAIEKGKGKGKDKRENILNVLRNLKSVFTGIYVYYNNAPKSESELKPEKIISERTKLRRQRPDKIAKRGKVIDRKLLRRYFEYSSPSDMYKILNETKRLEENKTHVNKTESRITSLIKMLESTPKSNMGKNRMKNKILHIVELILYFNKLNQSGKGLKILTPSQMLSRLPISLAQLKAGNNSEKLKNEIRQLLYSLYR